MAKINKHIEIVRSTSPSLSSMSTKSAIALQTTLRKKYQRVGITHVNTVRDLRNLCRLKPDLVFLGMKFVPTNDSLGIDCPQKIWVSDVLDMHHIAYTGSDGLAHELELNKSYAKEKILNNGIDTAKYIVIKYHETLPLSLPLSFPVFIKPTDRGGGQGIDSASLVRTPEEFIVKIQDLRDRFKCSALVEEYLPGREFSIALLKNDNGAYDTMPLELIAPIDHRGNRILSALVKSTDTERFVAVTDKQTLSKVTYVALKSFSAIGGRDYGRIDVRMDQNGVPHFLEANLIPSIIEGYGNFPKACFMNRAIGYDEMILRIVDLGFMRSVIIEDEEDESVLGFVPVPVIA